MIWDFDVMYGITLSLDILFVFITQCLNPLTLKVNKYDTEIMNVGLNALSLQKLL